MMGFRVDKWSARRRIAGSLLAVGLWGGTLGVASCERSSAPASASASASASSGAGPTRGKTAPLHVDTVVVTERDVPNTVLLAGSLKGNQESELAANAAGLVQRTMVERGSIVRSGAAIVQLDTRMASLAAGEAQSNLETARAQRTLAEEECERFQRLFQRGALSQQELDRQTTNCKTTATAAAAAENRALQARQSLGDSTIRAPFAGLIAERYVNVGEYVRADTKVAHLISIDPLRLELTIPETDIRAVREGQKVDFQVAALPDRTFSGTVHYIGPAVRASTRDLVFEAVVDNAEHLLRPGLFATARLSAGTRKLPVVPRAALRQEGDTVHAFVVINHQLEERILQTDNGAVGPGTATGPGGAAPADEVAVVSGLHAGERLVSPLSERIADGLEVE